MSESPMASLRFDAIVLGAGVSGLVSASVLQEQGCRRVLLIDEYPAAGGNHRDVQIGAYTFDIGSFIFQDDSPLVRRFPSLLARYVPIRPTWSRLNPQGRVTAFPISLRDDFFALGPIEWVRILGSALYARLFQSRLRCARDYGRYYVGARFLRTSGLQAYMTRMYGSDPRFIDLDFAMKRLQWIGEHASWRNPMLARWLSRRPKPPSNQQLARPREGFRLLYEPVLDELRQNGADVVVGARLERLVREEPDFVLQGESGRWRAPRLISTIPFDRLHELRGTAKSTLRHVTLISLFFSFLGQRGFDSSILYNFSLHGAWKRLTVYSDFYGRAEGREYFAVEVNAEHVDRSVDKAEADFRQHARRHGLFVGDLRLEGHSVLDNAYPIYVSGAGELAATQIRQLADAGITSLGRQGAFDYQPTARDSTLKAEARLDPGAGERRAIGRLTESRAP